MSNLNDESYEVIAKEITIALIQKTNRVNEEAAKFACDTFDKVYKQITQTVNGK